MLLSEMITIVRRRSRTGDAFTTDAEVTDAIDEAIKWFSTDARGLVTEEYLTLEPKFWTNTNMAFSLTITGGSNALAETDVVITPLERDEVTGTQVATDLQTQIRAAGASTVTVSWSTTTWKFTIDSSDGTAIEVGAPSAIIYSDACDSIFGTSGSQSASSWASQIPEDAAMEVDLPADFISAKAVEWDKRPLEQESLAHFISPEVSGDPTMFTIINEDRMRIAPVPTEQKELHLTYRYSPIVNRDFSGYQECGFTGKLSTDATGLAATTQYYFKVTEDGTQTEYDITTGADLTFAAVIVLMNAQTTGSTFSLYDGDLRCTSDSEGTSSSIALAAGSTGTDLFATLTGFSAFDTAVAATTAEVEISDEAESSVIFYAAALMALEGDQKRADALEARAIDRKKAWNRRLSHENSRYTNRNPRGRFRNYEVTV